MLICKMLNTFGYDGTRELIVKDYFYNGLKDYPRNRRLVRETSIVGLRDYGYFKPITKTGRKSIIEFQFSHCYITKLSINRRLIDMSSLVLYQNRGVFYTREGFKQRRPGETFEGTFEGLIKNITGPSFNNNYYIKKRWWQRERLCYRPESYIGHSYSNTNHVLLLKCLC